MTWHNVEELEQVVLRLEERALNENMSLGELLSTPLSYKSGVFGDAIWIFGYAAARGMTVGDLLWSVETGLCDRERA